MINKEGIERFAKDNNMTPQETEHQINIAAKHLGIDANNIKKFLQVQVRKYLDIPRK